MAISFKSKKDKDDIYCSTINRNGLILKNVVFQGETINYLYNYSVVITL